MAFKTYQIRLEFILEISESLHTFTDLSEQDNTSRSEPNVPSVLEEMLRKEKELLDALLYHPVLLDKYVRRRIVDLMTKKGTNLIGQGLDPGVTDKDILEPLLQELDPKTANYFEAAFKESYYQACLTLLNQCFELRLADVSVDEIRKRKPSAP